MTRQDDTRRKSRRDLLLILLILPFGVLCMFLAGQAAIRLAPNWALPANMLSNLDPNNNYAGLDDRVLIEPLNPGILTQPVWDRLFMTPDAAIPTREVIDIFTPIPVRTQPPEIETPVRKPSPTATATFSGPIIPTSQQSLKANLAITKTDASDTYTPGKPISFTIVVTNSGPDEAEGFHIEDIIPANITNLTVNCSSTSGATCGVNASSGNVISFRRAAVKVGSQITITVNGLVLSGATGNLSNTAQILIPGEAPFNDSDKSNNTATDTDTRFAISDLAITKSDGSDTYTANSITYTIVVTNSGPSDALGVRVVDNLPPQIASWTWTCIMTNATGCNGVTGSTANFTDNGLNIQVGGIIEYTVTANLPANANTNLTSISNTASILLPGSPSFIDLNMSNNTATDTDIPYIDLQITKNDGGANFAQGGTLSYTVIVTNNSTFDLAGITVSDPKPTQLTNWTWCISLPCPAPINTNFTDTIDLTAGNSQVYSVEATVSGNLGLSDITNTATVSVPSGLVDADPTNNTATETTPPNIDLQVTKTDGVASYTSGGALTYTVTVTNNGAFDLTDVTVTDIMPTLISSWSWNCAPVPPPQGATCDINSGTGSLINNTVNLPAGNSITYTIDAIVHPNAAGILENTASVAPPAGIVDIDTSNNTAVDSDINIAGEPDIGPPDGNLIFPAGGTISTYLISPTITSDGTNAPDFVYYEQVAGNGIGMDVVIVELSQDGGTWVPVLNWGDDIDDTNTNVSLSIIGNGINPLDPEYDGRGINESYLYNNSGITIDIDSLGLSGSYPWIRFICPVAGNTDDSCDIDSIQPYYP